MTPAPPTECAAHPIAASSAANVERGAKRVHFERTGTQSDLFGEEEAAVSELVISHPASDYETFAAAVR